MSGDATARGGPTVIAAVPGPETDLLGLANPGAVVHAEALRSAAEFRGIFEEAPDALFVVDADGLIYLVNRKAESLFGYSRQEMVGKPVDMLVSDRARSVYPFHQASRLTSPTAPPTGAGLEATARHNDGSEFPVGVSWSSWDTEHGVLVSVAVRDITDRRRVEMEKMERGQVEVRLVEVERDEQRSMLEAQLQQAQRLESIGQLAGSVAHDFNNLLAGIMNYAGLVSASLRKEMELRGLSKDEVFVMLIQDVDEICGVAKRAAALTHQLLTFTNRTVVRPEVLDLNSVVADMEKLLRTTIGERVDLRMVFASDLPLIKADRGQIDQVLMNLAVNARDAMPAGGDLQIETASFEVDEDYARIHAINPGTFAQMTVSDTGTGMSQEVADRSFEPFFSTKDEGSGLGLATVYGIVSRAGGDIVIDSELGSGTAVRINLPATKDAMTRPRDATPDVHLCARGETVLIVEDEEIVREPARRLLAMHGYTVLAAANADSALAIIADHPTKIDLLLTDVVMPGRSGQELSVEVLKHHPATKVLFMSGYSHDVIAPQGVLGDGVSLLEKPFLSEELLMKARDVLDGLG
jgi:PAS domain S-box-containing protein